jgi:hypothetical protein
MDDREGMRCHCYISSIYFTGFGFLSVFWFVALFVALLCAVAACMYPYLCCYCHCVDLMLLFMLSDIVNSAS